MRAPFLLILLAFSAQAFASPADILDANKTATAGASWDSKAALRLENAYAGQGLTGTTASLQDLKHGAFVDSYAIGPQSGTSGYDGARAWEKEPSGTVTPQAGGDVVPLAVTESYQMRNLWWRKDRGGAEIKDNGRIAENGRAFDVLIVTPKGGKPLTAWFDAQTHLLARTVEVQGTLTIKTSYSDYRPVESVKLPYKMVIDDGSGNPQTITLKAARFLKAQPATAFAAPKEDLHDYAIGGGAHEATVPFRLINNHIYADVSVNGSAPMNFMFDTGGHSILQPQTAKDLHIPAVGSQSSTGSGGAIAQSGLAMVDTFRIGAVTFRHQPVTVLSFDSKAVEGVEDAGMMGYELFARFVTRFDYDTRTITFIDRNHFDPKDAGTPVAMRLYHQFPEVLGTYDGIPARFGVDTGSRWALLLTGPFAAEHHLRENAAKGVVAAVGWGVGGSTSAFVQRGAKLTLGDVVIPSPLTGYSTDKGGVGASEAFPNNLGGGVLKRFVVTIDYQHSVLYLKPIQGPIADLDAFDRSGLWLNEADGGFKVFSVTKDSPAEEAGLKTGDIIVSVNGKPAKDIALYTLRQELRDQAPGTIVTLGIRRSGNTQDVKLTLRDLI